MEALALRRGACAEGLDLGGRSRDYFATVDQEYVAAVAEAADTALASGQALRILALLKQVAVGESLNEALQARLMLMLAATGQQALALAHYQAVRKRLIGELGVDPGAEMRAAYDRVLRQELPVAAATNLADPLVRPGSAGTRRRQAVLSYSPPGALLPWCLQLSCSLICPHSQVANRSCRSCQECSAPAADAPRLPFARSMAWRASARLPLPFTGPIT